MYYFILNFLSFESVNALNLFYALKNSCSIHGITSLTQIRPNSLNLGYPISYLYKELADLFSRYGVFILIKENPKSVLNHILFGYYNKLYNEKIIKDFKTYFNVDFNNINEEKLKTLMDAYYAEVEARIGSKLIVIDLTKHNDSFVNFIKSPDFLSFVQRLNSCLITCDLTQAAISLQTEKIDKMNYFIKDYFIKSPHYGLPDPYTVNRWMNNASNQAFGEAKQSNENSYLLSFIEEFNDDETMAFLWDQQNNYVKAT